MTLEELIPSFKEMIDSVEADSLGYYVYKSVFDCLIELKERREKDAAECEMPADIQEIKHGKWDEYGLEEKEGEVMYTRCFRCSECNYKVNEKFKFCPNCGVRMEITQ